MVIDEMAANIKQVQSMPPKENTAAKVPSESISFKDMPGAGKIQMAAKAGIEITAEDILNLESQLAKDKTPQGSGAKEIPATSPQMPQEAPNAQTQTNIPPEIAKALEAYPEPIQKLLLQMDPEKMMVLLQHPR